MLTLGIRYLTGYAAAARSDDREHIEWPPHPARLFMALAAAHFTAGADDRERAALEWLERQGAPLISAGGHYERSVVSHFVPINDDPIGKKPGPLQSVPGLLRHRAERVFPRAWLEREFVYFTWPHADPNGQLAELQQLCAKTTRIGHPSCLIQAWASSSPPPSDPSLVPNAERPEENLRIAVPGTLQLLRDTYKSRPDEPPHPSIPTYEGYAAPSPPRAVAPGTIWDPEPLIYALERRDGPVRHLDSAATLQLTERVRAALLEHLGVNAPESLSGHHGTERARAPHLAILALPFVSHEHADGRILGLAFAPPRGLPATDRNKLLKAVAAIRKQGIKLGPLGLWSLEGGDSLQREALRARTWTRPASRWASVTPYVYDHHPNAKEPTLYSAALEESIRQSWLRVCQSANVGLSVDTTTTSPHIGTPLARNFPRMRRKDGSECRHTHVILRFTEPIVGPLILGAGRFRGYGLFRPLPEPTP